MSFALDAVVAQATYAFLYMTAHNFKKENERITTFKDKKWSIAKANINV